VQQVRELEVLYSDNGSHYGVDEFLREAAECRDAITATTKIAQVRSPEDTLQELKGKAVRDRIKAVGETNLHLLRLLARHPDGMRHSKLVNPLYSELIPPTLNGRTPDELIYRVLFLISIELVEERRSENEKERLYPVREEVLSALSPKS
jgi:hypothetical protein